MSGGTPPDEDKARELHGRTDPEDIIAAAVAAVQFVLTHAESNGNVGAVGFCFGGGGVNRMAAVWRRSASTSKPLWSIMGCRSPQTGCTHSLGRRALRRHEFRFGPIIVREQSLEGLELGQVVEDDVRIVRMMDKVVLMVGLGWIEGLKRLYAGRDASLKYVCVIELSDVAAGDHELRLVA